MRDLWWLSKWSWWDLIVWMYHRHSWKLWEPKQWSFLACKADVSMSCSPTTGAWKYCRFLASCLWWERLLGPPIGGLLEGPWQEEDAPSHFECALRDHLWAQAESLHAKFERGTCRTFVDTEGEKWLWGLWAPRKANPKEWCGSISGDIWVDHRDGLVLNGYILFDPI